MRLKAVSEQYDIGVSKLQIRGVVNLQQLIGGFQVDQNSTIDDS
jgi:hypothetical protein